MRSGSSPRARPHAPAARSRWRTPARLARDRSSGPPQQRMPLALLGLLREVAQLALTHVGLRVLARPHPAQLGAHEPPLLGTHRWHGQPPATQPTPSQTQNVLSTPSYHSTATPSMSASAAMAIHVAHLSSWRSCVHSSSPRSGWTCGPQARVIAGPAAVPRAP